VIEHTTVANVAHVFVFGVQFRFKLFAVVTEGRKRKIGTRLGTLFVLHVRHSACSAAEAVLRLLDGQIFTVQIAANLFAFLVGLDSHEIFQVSNGSLTLFPRVRTDRFFQTAVKCCQSFRVRPRGAKNLAVFQMQGSSFRLQRKSPSNVG
jgi:hypothetical protein